MPDEKKKPARFDLSLLRQEKAPEPVEAAASPQAVPAAEEKLEQFGSHMLTRTKRALKMAAADEGRKQYEVLHDAVTAYLKAHHPSLVRE